MHHLHEYKTQPPRQAEDMAEGFPVSVQAFLRGTTGHTAVPRAERCLNEHNHPGIRECMDSRRDPWLNVSLFQVTLRTFLAH